MNNLIALYGAPREVGGQFWAHMNKLITLEGGPKEVGGGFSCYSNKLISLVGSPTKIGGNLTCIDNPIYQVYKLFPDYKSYLDSLDYDYLRGTSIIRWKFQ